MLTTIADLITARPKRTLLAVVAFVLVAGLVGGPVAGALEDAGGFTPEDSGSVRAVERIEEATGSQASAGVVALLRTPSGADSPEARRRIAAVQRELAAQPGIASVTSVETTRDPRFVSRDGRATYVAATLDADADEDAVIEGLDERFGDVDDVALGGSLIGFNQIGDSVEADLGPRRDARVPGAAAALAPLLPRPRRGAAARGRAHHRRSAPSSRSRRSTRSTGSRSSR